MRASRPLVTATFVVAAIAWCGAASSFAANLPTGVDAPASPATPSAIDISQDDRPARAAAREREPRGNPLWAIPLSSLAVTRERPLFLPSRRPPVAPAVAGPPVIVVPKPVEEPRPELTLVGTIAGETEGFAIFIDLRSSALVRLRTGQEHGGWTLASVKGREVTLAKDRDTIAFMLPAPGANGAPPTPGMAPVPDGSAVAAAATGASVAPRNPGDFAPFVPRGTPKNGEHDGL
jgi:general secretion pathway protein N